MAMQLTAESTSVSMSQVCQVTIRRTQEYNAMFGGLISFYVVPMCHSRRMIHVLIEAYNLFIAMRHRRSPSVLMQVINRIAMWLVQNRTYLGLSYGNASHEESILCLQGIHSIAYGNASYGIIESPE